MERKENVSDSRADICSYTAYFMLILYTALNPITQVFEKLTGFSPRGMSVIGFFLLLIYAAGLLRKIKGMKIRLNFSMIAFISIFLIFVIYILSYPLISTYPDIYYYDGDTLSYTAIKDYYFSFLRNNLMPILAMWAAGSEILKLKNILNKKAIRLLTFSMYIMLSLMLMAVWLKTGISDKTGIGLEGSGISYITIGDNLAIFTLLLLGFIKRPLLKCALIINSFCWLYLISSRTSFYLFCGVIFVLLAIRFLKLGIYKKMLILNIAAGGIALLIFIYSLSGITRPLLPENSRMTAVITDLTEDASFQGRLIQFKEGFEDIKQFWLTGRLFREIERTGISGTYMHNIFSYWVEYGLVPFLLLFSLCIVFLYKDTKNFLKHGNDELVRMVFMNSLFLIMCAFISRAYVNFYIWFAISSSAVLNDYYDREFNRSREASDSK